MAFGVAVPSPPIDLHFSRREESKGIPWYIWCCLAAVTCSSVGVVWDISWHKTIGRDSFLTPAHLMIYLSGILAGISCAYLILSTTFNPNQPLSRVAVGMWWFRGPLGAFLCAWGCVAMLTSAPFDDWWHNAYGLDVKVLSPPHMLLTLGMVGIRMGSLLLVLSHLNRASGKMADYYQWMALYLLVFLSTISVGAVQEFTVRNYMHSAQFYLLVGLTAPLWFATVPTISRQRWGTTIMGACYMGLFLIFIWILPLFPAEPKLGPVFFKTTRMIPPDFPLLFIVPAFGLDLLRTRMTGWSRWKKAAGMGTVFLGSFFAVQFAFAYFLMSPLARNYVFGAHYIPFFADPSSDYAKYTFTAVESTVVEYAIKMALAFGAAIVMSYAGLSLGVWMRRVRR